VPDFKLLAFYECCICVCGWFPGVWILCRHIKFRRWVITHKQEYNKINCVYFRRGMYPDLYEAHSEFNIWKTADPAKEKRTES
jgi:hypothetical protein